MSQPLSCLNFSHKCPVAIILGIAPPTGGSNKYLQSTSTVINLPNLVKAYQTLWFPVTHFSCHYSDPFLLGMNGAQEVSSRRQKTSKEPIRGFTVKWTFVFLTSFLWKHVSSPFSFTLLRSWSCTHITTSCFPTSD